LSKHSPEAKLLIDLVWAALVNITSCDMPLPSDSDWLNMTEETREARQAVCQKLDCKDLFQVRYLISQPGTVNSLRFSTEQEAPCTLRQNIFSDTERIVFGIYLEQ
jgi:hypothetical protein